MTRADFERRISSILTLQVRGALSGWAGGCSCVHEQATKTDCECSHYRKRK